MKEVKADIYGHLRRNNTIVWAMAGICLGISIFSIWTAMRTRAEADRFIYGLSKDEKLLPLELIDKKEVQHIFEKSHVQLFMEKFYSYDQWNYKDQIEKSLWLIDSDNGKKLYDYYKEQGHYNRMVQTTSSQRISDIVPVLDRDGSFVVTARIEINKNGQEVPKRYLLAAKGTLVKVSQNYPLNPYGYLITNYTETNKTEIEDEEHH